MSHESGGAVRRSHRDVPWMTFALAVAATATAICMSLLAGWQRGGELPERLVWVAIGVVLVIGAHLLPALCRSSPWSVRGVGGLLWVACMATACFGHATFFVLAQQHAGERRASSLVPAVSYAVPAGRSLTAIMNDRASVVRQLAIADSQRCERDCPMLKVRRVELAARLDALNAEADDVRRQQTADDRRIEQRDALTADPVTAKLAVILGTTVSGVDVLSGLALAVVLEGVACLLWSLTLRPPQSVVVTPSVIDATSPGHDPVTPGRGVVDMPVTLAETEVMTLAREVAAGTVRATVSDIRRHLGCSQAKATTLRRQLAEQASTP
ncbi:hypothetical protein [Paraburkholderia fungorum]|uniref:hypothetical protein n=1 Tax=Paraburkholderia fungorum TaxID=134537 RepID=UPI0038B7D41D